MGCSLKAQRQQREVIELRNALGERIHRRGDRLVQLGKSVVYTTDSEHKLETAGEAESFAEFFRNADLVIFDAMYSLADAISVRADWGHSSNMVGVELCQLARAKHLVLFHHEPVNNDAAIEALQDDARRFAKLSPDAPVQVTAAYDGLEIEL